MARPTFLGLPTDRLPGIPFFQSLFKRSHFTYYAPSSFLDSPTFHLINPRSCNTKSDAIRQTLTANEVKDLSDEAILAAFTKGFFSGFVFSPEAVLLRLGVYKFFGGGRTGVKESVSSRHMWRGNEISNSRLDTIGSRYFGTFQIVDVQIAESTKTSTSYVDFAFGSHQTSFAGSHRFRLTRLSEDSALDDPHVEINLEAFRCNPNGSLSFLDGLLSWVHRIYARMLFADGIQSIIRVARAS